MSTTRPKLTASLSRKTPARTRPEIWQIEIREEGHDAVLCSDQFKGSHAEAKEFADYRIKNFGLPLSAREFGTYE
jgi:hypothetical protein